MEVEFSDFVDGFVLYVDQQVIGLVGGMSYLDLFADKLRRAFIEHPADGDRGVVLDVTVEGYLEGGVEFLFGKSFDRGGVFDIIHEPVYRSCVDAVMHVPMVFVLEP